MAEDPNTRLLGMATQLSAEHGPSGPLPQRSEEDMQFLRQALNSIQTAKSQIAKLATLTNPQVRNLPEALEERLNILESVDMQMEESHNVDELVSTQSYKLIAQIATEEGGWSPDEKRLALHILCNSAMNHLPAQMAFTENGVLDAVVRSSGVTPLYEAMYAVASICRGCPQATEHFLSKLDGVRWLVDVMTNPTVPPRVRRCGLSFFRDTVLESVPVTTIPVRCVPEMIALAQPHAAENVEEVQVLRATTQCLQRLVRGSANWNDAVKKRVREFLSEVRGDVESTELCQEILAK
eukprot:PhF_6_TR12896/c0_g1_i1/m.20304